MLSSALILTRRIIGCDTSGQRLGCGELTVVRCAGDMATCRQTERARSNALAQVARPRRDA